MTFLERAAAEFEAQMARASGPEAAFRTRAWADYEARGLPQRKNEAWRYSSIAALTNAEWTPGPERGVPASVATTRERWRSTFDVLVMVDGRLLLEESVISRQVQEALEAPKFDEDLSLHDGFTSLATAVGRGGVRLAVGPSVEVARPLLLVFAHTDKVAWTPVLNQIELAANASLDLAVLHLGEGEYLRSDLTRVTLGAGARLNSVRVQAEDRVARHFAETTATLAADSRLHLTQIHAGSAWTRASMTAVAQGPGAEATLQGLTFGRDLQHVDQRVEVNHQAAHTTSNQLFKGVLRDRARGILNGKIFIAPGAQKVASQQYNHNLLLGAGAEANTHPELEIYADDVKANHGASIGRLDEGRLFYLQSRGLPRDLAQRMLAQAFVADVVMKIPHPTLRHFAEARVHDYLPGFL